MLNVLLQNLMRMEHFEICILKLILKMSLKVMDQLNLNFDAFYFQKLEYTVLKS